MAKASRTTRMSKPSDAMDDGKPCVKCASLKTCADAHSLSRPPPLSPPPPGKLPAYKAVRQIRLDLDRTFYTHKMFMEKDGQGQQKLFRMLAVYASCNAEVG